jgi:ferredoxin
MKIQVFPDRCDGHGLCFLEDEDIYPLDDDGHTATEDGVEVPAGHEKSAERGAMACPVAVFRVAK